ncbi:hypothetical protein ACEOII_33940, partial [Pseudomonas aeruginosa]
VMPVRLRLSCNRLIEAGNRQAYTLPQQLIAPASERHVLRSSGWNRAPKRTVKLGFFQRGKISQDTIFAQNT